MAHRKLLSLALAVASLADNSQRASVPRDTQATEPAYASSQGEGLASVVIVQLTD